MPWSDKSSGSWTPEDLEAISATDAARVWHPYAPMPPTLPAWPVVAADGVRLQLADGRSLIDGMSSWWAVIHGYNHPVLNQAITAQLGRMAHVMAGGLTHPAMVDLAERLVALTPDGLEHVFFADSGSVAVEIAIKMAMQYWMGRGRPNKRRLLTVHGGYHGDTFAAMSVCDPVTGMHHLFASTLPEQLFAPRPAPRFGAPFHDADIAELASLAEIHADEVAAVILEPVVQGAGGMFFYSPDYLRELRQICDRHDLLLIADEIATGFGRTGEFFACDHADVRPDILCLGKALTGGYLSMAATLCTSEIADGICRAETGVLLHGPTFMGNALAAAVANASIDLLCAQPWRETIAHVEQRLRTGLEPARNLPQVVDVRVLGAIGVIETARPINIKHTQDHLAARGVWLRPFANLLYTMPPYIVTDEELGAIVTAMMSAADSQPA